MRSADPRDRGSSRATPDRIPGWRRDPLPRGFLSKRRLNLRRCCVFLPLFATLAIVLSGCSEANPGKFPEPKKPGATREGVTPFIPLDSSKTAKLTPKAKAAWKAVNGGR